MTQRVLVTLGDYRILQPIGAGGMGQVYVAEHTHLHKKYAVKVLPAELAQDRDFVARFHDEARVMAELRHPHIVQVHTMSQSEGVYYLAMDYVTGPEGRPLSLHDHLKAQPDGRVPADQVRTWMLQIADALAYAHQRGVVHRDLKPANILVDSQGNVKLTDFGLAKAIGSEFILSQVHETTRASLNSLPTSPIALDVGEDGAAGSRGSARRSSNASSVMGTYDYMAPEQRGDVVGPIDQRTDIYALGLVLYRMLTGKRPGGLAKRPSQVVRGLSRRWDRIVARCLAYAPNERYSAAIELAAALRATARAGRLRRVARPALLLAVAAAIPIWGPWARDHVYYWWQEHRASQLISESERVNQDPNLAAVLDEARADMLAGRRQTALNKVQDCADDCVQVLSTERDRLDADKVRASAETYEKALALRDAEIENNADWQAALAALNAGQLFFEQQKFLAAKMRWDKAEEAFKRADAATQVAKEAVSELLSEFRMLTQDRTAELDQYGGAAWQAAQTAEQQGRADDEAHRLASARRSLSDAVEDARTALTEADRGLAQRAKSEAKHAQHDATEAEANRFAPEKWREAEDDWAAAVSFDSSGQHVASRRQWESAARRYADARAAAQALAEELKGHRETLKELLNGECVLGFATEELAELHAEADRLSAEAESGNPIKANGEYPKLIARATALTQTARARQAQTEAEEARNAALAENAPLLAGDAWKGAEGEYEQAAALFKDGKADEAASEWQKAKTSYEAALTSAAEQASRIDDARTAFEALSRDAQALVEEHKPEEWEAIEGLIRAATDKAEAGDAEGAVASYGKAETRLREALKAAEAIRDTKTLRRRVESLAREFEADWERDALLLAKHGGQPARESRAQAELARKTLAAAAGASEHRQLETSQEQWQQAKKALKGALQAARALADSLARVRSSAKAAGIDPDVPPDFVRNSQISAALKALQELESARRSHPEDSEAQQLETALKRWTQRPSWQLASPMSAGDVDRVRSAAARHFGVPERRTIKLTATTIEVVLIPPGEAGAVTVVRPFYLATTETTQAQWEALVNSNPSRRPGKELPVDSATWEECRQFCAAVQSKETATVRLPTQDEWQLACLAGSTGPFGFGDKTELLREYGWYAGMVEATQPAGLKKANALGLFDMHGNVAEWCQDEFPGGYEKQRVVRGGAYKVMGSQCDCTYRWSRIETRGDETVGFRILVEIGQGTLSTQVH